jgi:hypothetical protein
LFAANPALDPQRDAVNPLIFVDRQPPQIDQEQLAASVHSVSRTMFRTFDRDSISAPATPPKLVPSASSMKW